MHCTFRRFYQSFDLLLRCLEGMPQIVKWEGAGCGVVIAPVDCFLVIRIIHLCIY